MKDLLWDNTLSVQVQEIDDDHRKLVDLFNLLNHAVNPYLSPSLIPPCASMVYFQKIAEWHYKAIIL